MSDLASFCRRRLCFFLALIGVVLGNWVVGPATPASATGPSLKEIKTPPADAQRHASGLVSMVLEKGTGDRRPDRNDVTKVHFTGYNAKGEVFRTSEGEQPGNFPLDKVFPGWSEGIQLMVVGEKRRLWIPAKLGPKNPRSGPTGDVVFDVELVAILDLPEAPTSLNKPAAGAKRLPSGASYTVLKQGAGDKTPGSDGRVLLNYTLWNTKGRTLDSTHSRNRPTAFLLDRMMPAFAEAIADMKVGERRNLWIPQFAHEGQWPNGPKGMMVFEVELVQILPDNVLQPQETPAPGAG